MEAGAGIALPLGISPAQIRSYPLHGLRGKAVIVIVHRLIKFERVNPEHSSQQRSSQPLGGSSGMGFLCKDAIARGDEGGIRVHCQ